MTSHDYLSTACWHELNDGDPLAHSLCRMSCKTCGASCRCPNHPRADDRTAPPTWVDQARELAIELLAAVQATREGLEEVNPDLARRCRDDPHLFWLRGETPPPGKWRPAAGEPKR